MFEGIVSFNGIASFDGLDQRISGANIAIIDTPGLATELDFEMIPGIWVTGAVGRFYRVEYQDELGNGEWVVLTTIQLTARTEVVVDASSRNAGKRIYRAVLAP
ncbi:MAG: hypothetical protein ACO1QB_15725 [Verrucomicrobiales bacterium]